MKRRTIALVCVWTLPSIVLLTLTAIVYGAFRIPPPDRLDPTERAAVLATLRTALADVDAAPPAVQRMIAGAIGVTVWLQGSAVVRIDAAGTDVASAVVAATRRLRDHPGLRGMPAEARRDARLQVDLVTGRGPLGAGGPLDQLGVPGIGEVLAVNPGVEGIGADVGGHPVLLLPHELVGAKLLSARRPIRAFPEFTIGIDLPRITQLLATLGGEKAPLPRRALYRFRTDSFVEAPDRTGPPVPLYRGLPPAPVLSAQALREAALRGGRYLVAHLAPGGRYIYEHDLSTGSRTDIARPDSPYSMPRHAGTTYFLAELYRITREAWLREPIERAFAHLVELLAQGSCGGGQESDGTAYDCVVDRGETVVGLGATALTVVALVEYQRATGDTRYLALARKLTAWLLYMQRPDGSFRHRYNIKTRLPDEQTMLLYYSGEAALAIARMHAITGDARYAAAAERALDWLVDWYDFFMGSFVYGEEHWTCIAAEAIWPAVANPRYKEFCHGYGGFLRAQQADFDGDQADYAGSYNLTPFVVPYNTPAGSRTEAMISAYLLGKHHGTPDPRVAAQVRAALQYALGQQIRPESAFNTSGEGEGAIPGTPIDRNIRIDYVQHVGSAMIRASEWIDTEP